MPESGGSPPQDTRRILVRAMFTADSDGRWFALHVLSRHEKSTALILQVKGYEEFVPMYRPRTRSSKRGREVELPLFSGYVFCRYNAQIKQPILTTPGVIRILGRGGRAAPLEDSDMDAIRRLAAWGMDVRPEPYVAAGQTVLVESGPLTGLLGTVVRSKSRHRLLISVALLQRSVSVEIDDWSLLSPGHRSDPLAPPHSPQPIYQPGVR